MEDKEHIKNSLVLYKSNSLIRAKNAIEITNKLANEQAEYYVNEGVAKFAVDDYNGAIEDYNKAIELNPNVADA